MMVTMDVVASFHHVDHHKPPSVRYLPQGSYVLHFVPGPDNGLQPLYWQQSKTFAKADQLTVTAGQTRTKINVELKP